jgi:hypothetical protein
MGHLAIPVCDIERSCLMLYNANGFALALGPTPGPIVRPDWLRFGVGLPDRDAVLALGDRLAADGVELVEAAWGPQR